MNEMKNFFNTASTDTIGECLNGEKLLNASRDAKGNTLLTFESAYEGYSDLLTIMPDGSVIGTFICDEEQRPQTVNDNPTMTDVATLLEDKKLSLMCSTSGMEAEDPSEGMELTFLDYKGKNPDILLCDEPTGALDYETGKEVLQLLQDICQTQGMTVMIITHNSALAPMAHKVIRFRSGKVTSEEVNATPQPIADIEW